MLYNTKSNT